MNDQNRLQISLVKARSVSDLVPADLAALQIGKFPTVGPLVRMCAVGDIMFSGRVGTNLRSSAGLFEEIAPVLEEADISFGNLESPLTGEIAPRGLFSASMEGAAYLKENGFNLIHLANNHVYDYGQSGLAVTINALRAENLIPLGVGDDLTAVRALVRTDINGIRIGWLGCGRTLVTQSNSGPNYWEFNEQELYDAVNNNRKNVDVLIVSIHIGLMYMDYPRPEHKEMAEKLMASGVDLILMHHAHVLQGVQITSEHRVCCYNLGNFVCDWTEGKVKTPVMVREQNEGAVFLFTLGQHGVGGIIALPIWTGDDCKVHWAIGKRGLDILNRLTRITHDLERNFVSAFKRQRAERNTKGIIKVILFHVIHGNLLFVLESLKKTRLEHVGMLMRWLGETLKRFAKGSIS